jgi:hypothetical protein
MCMLKMLKDKDMLTSDSPVRNIALILGFASEIEGRWSTVQPVRSNSDL